MPRSNEPIYLDNHATTRVDPRVLAAMLPWFSERYGNAASAHGFGEAAALAVVEARSAIAAELACESDELYFTSGATESDNLALKGVLASNAGRGQWIVNAAEHRAVLDPARRLRRDGHEVTTLPVDASGCVDPERIEAAIGPHTKLVSVMLANNEIGSINPIAEIAAVCARHGVLLHCDASQAVGRMAVDLSRLSVDLLSFTAHKLYGPKGVGALYVRRREPAIPLRPLLEGGGHERGLRSGTLPVPLIVGFAAAVKMAREARTDETARVAALQARLRTALESSLDGMTVHGPESPRLTGNLNVGFAGVDGDALLAGVTREGVAVSSGSACSSANPEPSHVLRAIGVPERLARASLRFGIGRFNTAGEIDRAAEMVTTVVQRLRGVAGGDGSRIHPGRGKLGS